MKFRLIALLLFVSCTHQVWAQQSMLTELSPEYLEKLIASAKKNYPRVGVFEAKEKIGEAAIKQSKLSYFEILSFSYLLNPSQISTVNPNMFNSYQFGFFVNIGSILQKPAKIKQVKYELEAVQAEKLTYERSLETEVRNRYYAYVQSLTLLKIKTSALMDAQSALNDVRYKFEKGELPLSNYNNALNMVSDQLQVKVTAETNMMISKNNLEEMVGQTLESIQ
ncbi:outer membrane efflux protein [Dyadobacter jejuensis]|uniref:Outer membrane efflux protein n=1 Tax=Dyadobacter jejuensis TaxID=1082580 RepID=A0A316ANR1_9BACT|nr:TolC family protein [Dyadobacter jejuensis]PWJ58774.1 outer membrane efflux protein [Dyadobacter jejuensis]